MLLFSNYIIYSEIDGYGLFTTEDIEKGQEVWIFNPLIDKYLTKDEIKTFPVYLQAFIYKYSIGTKGEISLTEDSPGWSTGNKGTYMISLDNNRFTNNSKKPNVIVVNGKVVAARDIMSDEEVTQTYGNILTN